MANLNVAVLGAAGYAKDLGKKGTASDLTFYNLKKGENTVTFIEPTRYPERLAPLFYSLSMAGKVILVVDEINPVFGETVLMLQAIGIKDGFLILRNYLSLEQIAPLIKGTAVQDYEVIADDMIILRERLLADVASMTVDTSATFGSLPVDHFFNVRGIGTVVLGSISQGVLHKHDALRALPGEKVVQVRSIQKHDEDYDSAFAGERTGLALKNLEIDDLDRGVVLTSDPTIKTSTSVTSNAKIVKYWPAPIKEGMVLHIGHWMQLLPGRVEKVETQGDWHEPMLTINFDKPLVHPPAAKAVLTYPEGGKLRVVGTIDLP